MFGSLKEKLARTRDAFRRVEDLFRSGRRRDEILDGLEEALILADVGVPAAGEDRRGAASQDRQDGRPGRAR